MKIELFKGDAAEWNAFLQTRSDATAAHVYEWRNVVERAYGLESVYVVARENGTIVGVLPLVYVRSAAFGKFLVSMPYLSYGGPVGSAEACSALVRAAIELARERGANVMELRCTNLLPVEMPHSVDKVACVMALPESVEALWKSFPAKLRSQLRRPRKEGITIRFGSSEIDPFFTVFARNMRDLGSPTHSRKFFRVIAEEFGQNAWFYCAYSGDVPVAAGCALRWKTEVEMTWASSLREFNSAAPNMLVYSSMMERAIAEGVTRFNFGRCTPDTGSHRFKKQWGTQDHSLFWYSWRADAADALPTTESRSLLLATRIWRRVPVPIATLLGPQLRKGIPA
jgi:serine/alanine adding enzyme